jgi:hypothetical protein
MGLHTSARTAHCNETQSTTTQGEATLENPISGERFVILETPRPSRPTD